MEILESYDLTRCAYSSAQLAGCDPKTVKRYVALREAGGGDPVVPAAAPRAKLIDAFLPKVEQLVDDSRGKSARTRCTNAWSRWGSPVPNGPPAGRCGQPSWPGGPGTGVPTGRGCPSPGCGCSSTGATDPASVAARRGCSVRGWPGRGSGW